MYDIQNLNVGDKFYYVDDYRLIRKLTVIAQYLEETDTLLAIYKTGDVTEVYACNSKDIDLYYINMEEAKQAYMKAIECKIVELSNTYLNSCN